MPFLRLLPTLLLLTLALTQHLDTVPWPLPPLQAMLPWLTLAALPLALGAALRLRSQKSPLDLTILLTLLAVLSSELATASPAFASPPPPCGPGLVLMSANLLMVNPDPAPLAQEILDSDADLLILQELSPRWVVALEEAGIFARWPSAVQVVQEDSFGSAILSKTPLIEPGTWELDTLPQTRAGVSLGGGILEVWNVHTLPPRTALYAAHHQEQTAMIVEAARAFDGPLLLAGDFNAPAGSRFDRRMRRTFLDAWKAAGKGPGFTWPNGVFFLPPLRLDHLYLSADLTVEWVRRGVGAHSDHRPLLAKISPRQGGRLCGG